MNYFRIFLCLLLLGPSLEGQPILPYLCDDKYGFIDVKTEKLLIPCQFDEAEPFNNFHLAVVKKHGSFRVIQENGAFLSDSIFTVVPEFKILPRNTVNINNQSKPELKPLLQIIDKNGKFLLLNLEDGYCSDRLFKVDSTMNFGGCGVGGSPPRSRQGNEFFHNYLRAFQLNKGFTFFDLNGRPLFGREQFQSAAELGEGFFTLSDTSGNLALANTEKRLTGYSYVHIQKHGDFIVGYPIKAGKKFKDQNEKWAQYHSAKFQLLDAQGKIIVDTVYFYPNRAVDPNLLIVCQKGKDYKYGGFGVISSDGSVVVPFGSWKLTAATNDLFIAQKDTRTKKFGIITKGGLIVHPIEFDLIEKCIRQPYFFFYRNSKMGIMDSTGRILFEKAGHSLHDISENLFTYENDSKTGLITANGTEILPAIYQSIRIFRGDSLFIAGKDNLFGVVDLYGHVLLPFKYTSISWHQIRNAGYAIEQGRSEYFDAQFMKMATWPNRFGFQPQEKGVFLDLSFRQGYINTEGDTIIPAIYTDISEYFDKDSVPLFIVKKENSIDFLDKKGKPVLPLGWKVSEGAWFPFNDEYSRICIQKGKEGGIVDQFGEWVLTPRNGRFFILDKFILEEQDGRYRFLDSVGLPAIAGTFDCVIGWGKNPFIVGQNILGETYSETVQSNFTKKDTIIVKNRMKLGCLDESGNWLFTFRYNALTDWGNGLFIASLGWEEGKIKSFLVDKNGTELLETKYDLLEFYGNLLIATKKKKKGIIDMQGKVLVPIEYEQLRFLYTGQSADPKANVGLRYANFMVRKNGKYLLLDQFGETILSGLNGDEDVSYYNGPFVMKLEAFTRNVTRYFLHNPTGEGIQEIASFKQDYTTPGYGIVTINHNQIWLNLENGKLFKN